MAKPIETRYAGRRFRSRLEARWGLFFDALRIRWDYEKEGFELNDVRFLPDFWLPEVTLRSDDKRGLWVEIKATEDAVKENEHKFWILNEPLIVFVGNPPGDPDSGYEYENEANGGYWDNNMRIMKCLSCGHVKIEFLEGNYMRCPKCGDGVDDEHKIAVEDALSERFGQ